MAIPPYRGFVVSVARVVKLSPTFTRVTFTGKQLENFGTAGLDQRIKLVFPRSDGELPLQDFAGEEPVAMMDWYGKWRELSSAERYPIRTYTIRAVRPAEHEIDVDFAVHGTEGVASAWAISAAVGQPLVIIGPDSRAEDSSGGIEWRPGSVKNVLLVGDETAVPAIAAILETLESDIAAQVMLEVPQLSDELPLHSAANVNVQWFERGAEGFGAVVSPAVREWAQQAFAREIRALEQSKDNASAEVASVELPDNPHDWDVPEGVAEGDATYSWIAGEAGFVAALRRHLVRECGVDRKNIAFMGYWKQGRSEGSLA